MNVYEHFSFSFIVIPLSQEALASSFVDAWQAGRLPCIKKGGFAIASNIQIEFNRLTGLD